MTNLPESLLFEMLGRKDAALQVSQRQISELAQRVQRAEQAEQVALSQDNCCGNCGDAAQDSPEPPSDD